MEKNTMKNAMHVPTPKYPTMRARTLMFSLLASVAFAAGCSESTDPGTTPPDDNNNPPPVEAHDDYGAACVKDSDCESGFCTTVSNNSDDAFCSYPCSEDSECPDTEDANSSCIFVQRNERLAQVCAPDDLCIDRDNDGYGTGPGCLGRDCDDNNPAINPGAKEICDGLDNNCDGLIDVNIEGMGAECDTSLQGVCAVGRLVCVDGQTNCQPNITPGQKLEICDGLDNDCDGFVDEGPNDPDAPRDYNHVVGLGETCGGTDDGCFEGIYKCDSEARTLICDGDVEVRDQPDDSCNYLDDNCNGEIDEDYRAEYPQYGTSCEIGKGACRSVGLWDCDPQNAYAPPVCNADVRDSEATTETCNYFDDDCDGVVDNGFVDANGVYNHVEHCGSCATNCNRQWSKDPAELNVVPRCKVTGSNASCEFDCAPGYIDYNGWREDGCEFKPNNNAIYVASVERGGQDSSSCGTYDTPCATIQHALSRASAKNAKQVLVGEGTFDGGFTLEQPIDVLGGHSSATWERDPKVNLTALRGGVSDGTNSYAVRIRNINGSKAAELSGFTIEAPDAKDPSGNSIGIWVINSNQGLVIRDNTILAGRGGTGAPGAGGNDGAQGSNGGSGKDRVNGQTSCTNTNGIVLAGGSAGSNTCGSENVSGGAGASTNCPTENFSHINSDQGNASAGRGSANTSGLGAAGRSPKHYRPTPPEHDIFGCQIDSSSAVSSPTPGIRGANGNDGTRGEGAGNASGAIASNTWRGNNGANGSDGTNGAGGGGGGSSGGIFQNLPGYNTAYHYGATGGGGGAGGCGATGGTGGKAGGGSFGMLIIGQSGNAPTITANELHRGSGGRGGQGGIGGVGGDGGAGGAGGKQIAADEWTRCGQHAADGGAGGRGGHGGGGGGGAGGVAFDIAISGHTNPDLSGNQFAIPSSMQTGGLGGKGGNGIISSGTNGATGASGSIKQF